MDQIVTDLARLKSVNDISSDVIESAALALDHFRSVAETARSRIA
jgi:hypothetical protein